jgi:uncharacterized protein (DUF2147 family)
MILPEATGASPTKLSPLDETHTTQSQTMTRKTSALPILLLALISLSSSLLAGTSDRPLPGKDDPDAIVGIWKNGEGTGHIQITRNGETYQGRIVWLKEPNDPVTGKPKQDKQHPDEAARNRPLMGLVNMWGFRYDKAGVWDGGKIYDPKKGSTYSCTIRIKDNNTLEVRGFIGISLIGRTDVWTRQGDRNR